MEDKPSRVSRREQEISIVDKGWNLITHNTELIFFIALGFIEVAVEAAGYRPFFRLNDLLPAILIPANNTVELPTADSQKSADTMIQSDDAVNAANEDFTVIDNISYWMDTVGAYTVHITLATYLLLPYPVITERQKLLLVPWLVVTLLRSVLRELVISFVAIVVCASHDVFFLPCLKYSALQGAQLCFIVYFWTSMHSFYHNLNRRRLTEERVNSVINTIKRSSVLYDSPEQMQRTVDRVLSVEVDEDDDNAEAALVERAAMAWIAREILENDAEYVTDAQFSQYLIVKATMELRQALKELAEKKRKARRKHSPKQRLEESLEYMKYHTKNPNPSPRPTREAFEESRTLSSRDPIRLIRPLTSGGKPVLSNMSIVTGISIFSDTTQSGGSVDSSSQTEPPTHQMSKLLDILEFQQQQRQRESLKRTIKDDDLIFEEINNAG